MTEKPKNSEVKEITMDSDSTQRIESSLFKVDMTILLPADNAWKKNPTTAEVFKLVQEALKSETHLNEQDFTIVKAMTRRI